MGLEVLTNGVVAEGTTIPFWAVAVILLSILVFGWGLGLLWRRCSREAVQDELSKAEEGEEETKSELRAGKKRKDSSLSTSDTKRRPLHFNGPSPTSNFWRPGSTVLKDVECLRQLLEQEKNNQGENLQLLSDDKLLPIPFAAMVNLRF